MIDRVIRIAAAGTMSVFLCKRMDGSWDWYVVRDETGDHIAWGYQVSAHRAVELSRHFVQEELKDAA